MTKQIPKKLIKPTCVCDGCGNLIHSNMEGEYHAKTREINNTITYGKHQRVVTYKRQDICGTYQKITKLGPIEPRWT